MRRLFLGIAPAIGAAALASPAALAQGTWYAPGSSPGMAIYGAAIEPATVLPGQSVRLHYTLSYDPLLQPPVTPELTLVGLPDNSVSAGTPVRLLSPGGPQVPMIADLRINPPARAGIYALSIRASMNGVEQAVAPVGSLAVQMAPAAIVNAEIVPGGLGVCSAGRQAATIRYTAEDDNGAATISRVVVSGLPPVATSALPSGPVGGTGLPVPGVGSGYAVTTVTPSRTTVTEGPGGQFVVSQSGLPTTTYTQTSTTYTPIDVAPPRDMGTAVETVTAPVTLPCLGPDPFAWRLGLIGYVFDPLTSTTRSLPPAPLAVP